MFGLVGFTDNPFRERSDLVRAAIALIHPLGSYRSPARARVKLFPSTAPAFDDVAAQLEGFARPLWAIQGLVENESDDGGPGIGEAHSWIQGIQAGVDPSSSEYWGDVGPSDQRMVEMESIAFALLVAPEAMMRLLGRDSKLNLTKWLQQINSHSMPRNNWRWFRVLVNLALVEVLGVPRHEVSHMVDEDFALLDEFYLGQGWSSDGIWGDERKQADYYSGSFAIQFAQLLYVRFAKRDEERVQRYRQQAAEFASQYWRYFDVNGAAIPFGRSLTYRFAFGAFWAALALVDIQLPSPVGSLGSIKGMLMRHLRWWSKKPEIFNSDGTMTIGYTYPNMYLCEDYNSRQSVYWCLKSFIVLGLPEGHPFWTCEEEPHPMARLSLSKRPQVGHPNTLQAIWPAHHILCNSHEHHYLLSSGQMTTRKFKAREAKYGKLAYSSAFGFSVPSGPELHQLAPDSTLSISLDDGETWKVRWQPFDVRLQTAFVRSHGDLHKVPAISSVWKPFKQLSVEIETILVPLAPHFPGWHIRSHKVTGLDCLSTFPCSEGIQLVDASFAISALSATGYHIPKDAPGEVTNGCFSDSSSILMISHAGSSGAVNITPNVASASPTVETKQKCESLLIEADPNTNLITQRTFIPSVRYNIRSATLNEPETATELVVFVTGVFGVSSHNVDRGEMKKMWEKRPTVQLNIGTASENTIEIS
ncbi:hypothetical protein LCI18_009185 [Fusarium solani-melongenae]|uniref:Uncharacterized protein n=1 Tax=Fusarium solani subsp. cucurbitae TaxID=2747967 RepID=A0ACD3ZAK6_FUSSC|nr:hypothetical protein LCI18_009185 [Fusarium solani-melongenae]